MAAFQNGRYIGYSHLHFSSVNEREKYVRLVAINPQMLVKFSNQMLVCSGGDGFEKPLQTPAFQFFDRPTYSFIVGELHFDGKGVLQKKLMALYGWPSYIGMGLG
jgi:hypothetical protein